MTDADLIQRYDGRVPRYTSYPTAPHFTAAIGVDTYTAWLQELPAKPLSLYLHVPFCERLCFYCGCHTQVVRSDAARRGYAAAMADELRRVADTIGRRAEVDHIHWGGGTPSTLPADCLDDLMGLIRSRFDVAPDAEVAVEIDPSQLPPDRLDAFAAMGVTRASLGVQDFEPAVQTAIGRIQSYEATWDCVRALRDMGIRSLNLDLIYGLPHQNEDTARRTARQVLGLNADRIAVFGYAHVPWLKRRQALIAEDMLPGGMARLAQSRAIGRVLQDEGGYVPLGLDHYARPGDSLARAAASGTLGRNFQGYTTDAAPALIGIGASAIGSLPQGYVQNAAQVAPYTQAVRAGTFATARGVALTPEDRLRRAVIERIMCDLSADLFEVAAAQDADPAPLLSSAASLGRFEADGLVLWDGHRVEVTARGRPFVRNVAAAFDAYIAAAPAAVRHARAV